jgi:hypothetical protein
MLKFKITSYQTGGDVWETIRHTKDGLDEVIKCILACEDTVRFVVEEIRYEV